MISEDAKHVNMSTLCRIEIQDIVLVKSKQCRNFAAWHIRVFDRRIKITVTLTSVKIMYPRKINYPI